MKEKIIKIFKNKNVVIALCVITLTITTIGYSYAAFFTVKTNKNNQTVTTGTLSVGYGGSSTSITKTEMMPLSDIEGLGQNESGIIHIQNNGTLDADYVLTVGYDMESFLARSDYKSTDVLTPLDYIKLAVYEYNGANDSTLITGPISVTELPIYKINTNDNRYNRYAILLGSLGATSNTTKTYQVKIWLSENASAAASKTYFYVNSEVIAEASETKMAYNISGRLVNSSGTALTGATISVQNNSIVTTTGTNGTFTLNGLLPNTYNVDITYNNVVYKGNLTIREGSSNALTSMGTTFTANSSSTITNIAYTYGTTISKIFEKNNITETSSGFEFESGKTYNLMPSYILTGGTNENISTLTITLEDSTISSFTLN